jgi:hypothetical protein
MRDELGLFDDAAILHLRVLLLYSLGKKISYSEEWGATISADILGSYDTDKQAIKAATEWLKGAK